MTVDRKKEFLIKICLPLKRGILLLVLVLYALLTLLSILKRYSRSSPPEVFCKKGVLRNFTGKHLCQSLFFNKVAGLFLEISQNPQENTFFIEHLWWLLLILRRLTFKCFEKVVGFSIPSSFTE